MKFPPGALFATPAALECLEKAGEDPYSLIMRHCNGDFGDAPPEDKKINEDALKLGLRVLSVYETAFGDRIWVVTEADRSQTTVMLPSDY